MKRNMILRAVTVFAGAIALASVFVHPFGSMKARSAGPLLAGAEADAAVLHTLEKSCQNCHSERTEWPWYSYVAPVSWLIENDVHQGRSHMNLSRWQQYDSEKQHELLAAMGAVARNHIMPPPRYTFLHPGSRPSPVELERIYQWTRMERRRLTALARATR